MRIYIFVIVTYRELTELSVKTVAAEIISSRRTRTFSSPVPERSDDLIKQRIVGVDRAAFAHSHVMRGIERRSSDIAYCTCQILLAIKNVFASQCITVIFDKPQIVLVAEFLYRLKIERIAQCVSDHDYLCLVGKRIFQLGNIDVVLRDGNVNKYRDNTILDSRSNCRRETSCNSDHLVTGNHLSVFKQRRSQCHESVEVC